jgi:hypothetical protein
VHRGSLPRLATLVLAASAIAMPPAPAVGATYLPPGARVWSGMTGGLSASDISAFARGQGSTPPVVQFFATWGPTTAVSFLDGLSLEADHSAARPAFALSMADQNGHEAIDSKALATGHADKALVGWNQVLADAGGPVYMRLFYQMNNAATVQCAFNADGSARSAAHSTHWFIEAWRRAVLVMRGGPVKTIDARLHALGLPPLKSSGALPKPPVAFLWVPTYTPVPAIAANSWNAYYPGDQYVDWVGTQALSNYTSYDRMDSFYSDLESHHHKPFTLDQWGIFQTRDDPGYVSALFSWVRAHSRVRLLIYNQGFAGSPMRLQALPLTERQLRSELRSAPFR